MPIDGISCIDGQVDQGVFQLRAVGQDRMQVIGNAGLEFNLRPNRALQQLCTLKQGGVGIEHS